MRCHVALPAVGLNTRFTCLLAEIRDAEPLKLHSGSVSGSGPAQQAKTNTTHIRLSTRCFPGGRTLCTNWLHTGADLIQGIVSYVRIKTRTLKKFFRTTLTRISCTPSARILKYSLMAPLLAVV